MVSVAIVCGTVFACFVVAAVMLERHKRFWLARKVDSLVKTEAELGKLVDDAGKFSLDVSERLEALRMDLIRVETMIGMGGKR